MSILMNKSLDEILHMKLRHFNNLWDIYYKIQREQITGKPEPKIYEHEIETLNKFKEWYNGRSSD